MGEERPDAESLAGNPIYLEDNTAGAYLTQARAALLDCAKPRKLYGSWREPADVDKGERLGHHLLAQARQLDFARTSILFSALSAEAYINGFLWRQLSTADFEAVERLPTDEKYVLGPELALQERLFDRGAEPAQSIDALFKLRHDLVHPKGKQIEVGRDGDLMDPRFEDFNPQAAARFIIRVAEAAATLAEHEEGRKPDRIVVTILDDRDKLMEFGRELRDRLPEPPKSFEVAKAEREKREAETGQPEPGALLKARVTRPDPLKLPPTVPQRPAELYSYLSGLGGTATWPMPPEGGFRYERRPPPPTDPR
jgi:hypothetical protein